MVAEVEVVEVGGLEGGRVGGREGGWVVVVVVVVVIDVGGRGQFCTRGVRVVSVLLLRTTNNHSLYITATPPLPSSGSAPPRLEGVRWRRD